METYLDCIPCFVNQALAAARHVTGEESVHQQITRDILRYAAEMDLRQPPPVMGQLIHRRLRELVGIKDPYRESKSRFNRLALDILPEFAANVEEADDSFELAVRYAIAGNVIDFGPNSDLTEDMAREFMRDAADFPLSGSVRELQLAVESSDSILYIADNAGEIVFDRLLVRKIPRSKLTVAVRGMPIINDATLKDAVEAGMDKIANVIDNGSDVPGIILSECSDEFKIHFQHADLVIAKGQGNYETLSGMPGKRIFFLFKVKCRVIAHNSGFPEGSHVIAKNKSGE